MVGLRVIPDEERVVPLEKSIKRILHSSGRRETRARWDKACMGVSWEDVEEEEEEEGMEKEGRDDVRRSCSFAAIRSRSDIPAVLGAVGVEAMGRAMEVVNLCAF